MTGADAKRDRGSYGAPSAASRERAREARLAAAKAARATAPSWEELSVPVTDLRPGDFLVKVPSQHRIRGARYEGTIREALSVHAGQVVDQAGPLRITAPRAGVVPVVYRDGTTLLGAYVWPSHFTAIIRRPTAVTTKKGNN